MRNKWLNEPGSWDERGDELTFQVEAHTDFWRKTHDGAVRDNGHFRYQVVSGDFVAEVRVAGQYGALYDQAGIMVRADEAAWLKCGIEYLQGVQHASAVVTRDYSDWSVVPLPENPAAIFPRVKREGGTFEVSYSLDGSNYTMIRTAHLTEAAQVQIGLMACAPKGDGFGVTFDGFTVTR